MKAIKTILSVIKKIEYVILVAIFCIIVVTTFLQVIGRYTPIPFSGTFEEIATFSFVWATMIGAGTCVHQRSHMSMDFVVGFLPASKKVYSALFNDIVAFLVSGGVVYAASLLIPKIRKAGMISASLELPLWIHNLAVPIGFGLVCFWSIVCIVEDIQALRTHSILPEGSKE